MADTLDVRGEICPYPMMRTVSALKQLSGGDDVLEVVTDHAPALDTIPTQAARLGFATEIQESGWLGVAPGPHPEGRGGLMHAMVEVKRAWTSRPAGRGRRLWRR